MKTKAITPSRPAMPIVELDGEAQETLRAAQATCGGSAFWRHRKLADFEDILNPR